MRSIRSSKFLLAFAACLAFSISFIGCGHGNTVAGTGVPTSITVVPSSLSLNPGQVVQLNATLLDANGNSLGNTVFTYAATGGVTVSSAGLVCAGTWDSLTTPVICTPPANAVGAGSVTVTSQSITQTVNAAIHPRIARVTVVSLNPPTTPASAPCNSQNETQQFAAKAFDANGADITSQAGTFTFASSNTSSVTIDATGLATAVEPGGAFITASVNGVFSVPSTFNSCQPLSIVVTPSGPFTLAVAGTQQLTTTVTDTKGNAITGTGLTLSYLTSQPAVATVSSAGLITAVAAGSTAIEVSCSPPSCNGGANANIPVYSNLVTASVSGTSSTTVYATGATATSIIPIDTTTNIAGTAITIPQVNSAQPKLNSFVMSKDGVVGYLGSDLGLLLLTTSSNTLSRSTANTSGKVLAASTTEVIYADQSASPKTYVYNIPGDVFSQLPLTTVTTAAAFSPDNLKAYLISGGQVWTYSTPLGPPLIRQVSTTTTATDVNVLTQGSLAYVAGVNPNEVEGYANCQLNPINPITVAVPVTPLKIASSFDSTHVFAVDGTSIDNISVSNISTPPNQNCPATATNSVTTTNFAQGAFTPDELIVSPDGSNVFVATPSNKLLRYTVSGNAISVITLATGSAITTGGITLDGQNIYLGATGTNDVHRISVSGGSDAQQITVGLKDTTSAAVSPDFVVVRPK